MLIDEHAIYDLFYTETIQDLRLQIKYVYEISVCGIYNLSTMKEINITIQESAITGYGFTADEVSNILGYCPEITNPLYFPPVNLDEMPTEQPTLPNPETRMQFLANYILKYGMINVVWKIMEEQRRQLESQLIEQQKSEHSVVDNIINNSIINTVE